VLGEIVGEDAIDASGYKHAGLLHFNVRRRGIEFLSSFPILEIKMINRDGVINNALASRVKLRCCATR
jgi:hypothetical protein